MSSPRRRDCICRAEAGEGLASLISIVVARGSSRTHPVKSDEAPDMRYEPFSGCNRLRGAFR